MLGFTLGMLMLGGLTDGGVGGLTVGTDISGSALAGSAIRMQASIASATCHGRMCVIDGPSSCGMPS
jgi:hypothetical protein